MSYLDGSIASIHQALVNHIVTPSELVKEALERAKSTQPLYNSFVTILEAELEHAKQFDGKTITNPLFGIPYALKDNFSTKGILTTGSSNILKDYIPVFDSTVYQKLQNAGACMIGKTVLDELAMGGTGMSGHTGSVKNPWSIDRMAGGSSAGSVAAVAAGIVPFAIGSDTGDSVRKPAAYCGVVGFKPTWGRISRFGLFPFAPSLDHVGFFTRSVEDSAYVLEALSGVDHQDMTTSTKEVEPYASKLNASLKGVRIAVIQPIIDSIENEQVKANFAHVIELAEQQGAIITKVMMDLRLLKALLPVYMVISCAEATSNNANLDGIKFGPRGQGSTIDETIIQTRTQGFGELIKRRFVLGSYCLARENQEQLFLRAQKIRRRVVRQLETILSSHDVIILPASGNIAPKFMAGTKDEKLSNNYLVAENHLVLGNFSGYPSITIPTGFVDSMPIGINIMATAFAEQMTLNVAYGIESLLPYKNQIALRGGR